ncbi:Bcr/CflA family multidrug efflux MFS transporter [Pedobacter arcticus]|uniref:Bcr/CflA family multidrug efflux MFS transporter n=1 Tax=Pedobacter arcticus TaxID=752140 RepID=UPI0003811E0C|nr:Bcr/CflA family multidrug efflux MFS transporter [Pedobacter arcticus]
MTRKRHIFLVLILGTLTTLGPFSIDMYLPGFPAIAKDLNTTINQVSLSLASFFVGISLGQLLYGPLLDKFGRKKPLYIGLAVYILASIGCAQSHHIESLIALRFVQAIGSCAAAVAAMAMVRDFFPVKENAKIFALLMLVVGASPMIAPTAGGYLTASLGWQSVFYALAIIAIAIFVVVFFFLPEGFKGNPSLSLKPKPILNGFKEVLVNPQFYTYTFAGAFSFSGLFAYISSSPLVYMDIYEVSETTYGWIFAILSVGFIGASQVNNILLKKFRSEQIIPVALASQLTIAVIFVIGTFFNWFGLYETTIMLFLFLCCIGIANPNGVALSLAPFSDNAGTASSLMGAIQLGAGALASLAIGLLDSASAIPMTVVMSATSLIALLVLLLGRKNITEMKEIDNSAESFVMH